MALPLIALGIGAAASVAQTISGIVRANKARKALENYRRQELSNIADGLSVSTLGADLQREEASRSFGTSLEALRSGGVRGLVGGVGQLQNQQNTLQRTIGANLDEQQKELDRLKAEDEARIRAMIEERESQEIAGLGAEMGMGKAGIAAGLSGLTSLAGSAIATDWGGSGGGNMRNGAKGLGT